MTFKFSSTKYLKYLNKYFVQIFRWHLSSPAHSQLLTLLAQSSFAHICCPSYITNIVNVSTSSTSSMLFIKTFSTQSLFAHICSPPSPLLLPILYHQHCQRNQHHQHHQHCQCNQHHQHCNIISIISIIEVIKTLPIL